MSSAIFKNFLGHAPDWYKQTILAFLVINPILYFICIATSLPAGTILGWVILAEFIFTLAMTFKCHPLPPGGLIALQAVILGLTTTSQVYYEISLNLKVILLLMFMVAGIFFMKDLLLFIFTKLLLKVKNKTTVSLLFVFAAAFLSAFLDALTVTAVLISVAVGFYTVYHQAASGKHYLDEHDLNDDSHLDDNESINLEKFKLFLCNLLMHGAVGTALGGVCTIVGEPQNLLIASIAEWDFIEFFIRMAPISIPVLIAGLITTLFLERFKVFGYGAQLPERVRDILQAFDDNQTANLTDQVKAKLLIQLIVGLILMFSLAFSVAAVGLIGLMIIILLTSFTGIIEEKELGKAFEEALPFTALLVVFFAVVAVIHDQYLFKPVIDYVFLQAVELQAPLFFIANGILSMISDNVFVATIYINEIKAALDSGEISRDQFDALAVAINTGTNLPSVATPNGQAAFLFLLTSSVAPLIGLSYLRMVKLALPYTIVLTSVGLTAIFYYF